MTRILPCMFGSPSPLSPPGGRGNIVALLLAFALLLPGSLHSESQNYNAPENNVSSVLIFERGDYARVYGIFEKGVGRIAYDDQTKILDNLKLAFLIDSFKSSSRALNLDLFGATAGQRGGERELAFVQNEPARFDMGDKVNIKGDLIINGMRRPAMFQATLNKFGRINQSTDVGEDGPLTMGLSMHTSFKRSDFGLSLNKNASPFADEVLIMFDIVAVR